MSGNVLHFRMEADPRRVALNAYFPGVLEAGFFVRWALQPYCASMAGRENLKLINPVIQNIRAARPVLFIPRAFGERPDLVASVIEPFSLRRALRRREVLPEVQRIYK